MIRLCSDTPLVSGCITMNPNSATVYPGHAMRREAVLCIRKETEPAAERGSSRGRTLIHGLTHMIAV
jgi:hypothetical protein